MKLISWGDADMINFYNHHNEFILPIAAEKKPCGESYSYYMKKWNCNFAVPFSCFHKYSRSDSISMNKYITPLKEHYNNFNNSIGELLPAFIKWESNKSDYLKIDPEKCLNEPEKFENFGDNWTDELEIKDQEVLKNYFLKFDHLKKNFGFINFRVGNKDFAIKLSNRKEGIEFNTPRNSLIFSIQNNIFDDILIGNFMRTRLINVASLYPDFTPYVSKYGDNGKARTDQELKKYFDYYKLNSANYWLDYLKIKSESIIRPKIEKYKNIYFAARYIKRKLF